MHQQNTEMKSEIVQFFDGQSVFITGATGFLGKVLLEKLLRSCPGIDTIYLLVRDKRGKNPNQRVLELVENSVFNLLRERQPNFVNKIVPVLGDISLPHLGLSEVDRDVLKENVSVVFHNAATVKYTEPLKVATDINILGTKRILEVCSEMPKIKAIIHVSTAFCNCRDAEVFEKIYPTEYSPQQIIDLTSWLKPQALEAITPLLLGDSPNTYIFTKAITERLVEEEHGSLPVAIVRPAGVYAAWKEPEPGWTDNLNGLSGIIVFYMTGLLRSMLANRDNVANVVPADVSANLIIAAAWYVGQQRSKDVIVFNNTSAAMNKLTWGQMIDYVTAVVPKYPSTTVFRHPKTTFRKNKFTHRIFVFLEHYVPAFISDTFSYVTFRKRRMLQTYKRLHSATDGYAYFATREFHFSCKNSLMLSELLSEEDKKIFYVDVSNIDWKDYWEKHVIGVRKYILKQDPSTIPAARITHRRNYVISKAKVLIFWLGVYKVMSYFFHTSVWPRYHLNTMPFFLWREQFAFPSSAFVRFKQL